MSSSITVTVGGVTIPATIMYDYNLGVESFSELQDLVLLPDNDTGIINIDGVNVSISTDTAVNCVKAIKAEQFNSLGQKYSTTNDNNKDAEVVKPFGLTLPYTTVLIFCYDYNLLTIKDSSVVSDINSVVFPINGKNFIYTSCDSHTISGGTQGDSQYHSELRNASITLSDIDGVFTQTIEVAPINAKINRIIALRLAYNEFINVPRSKTGNYTVGPFLCPKVYDNNMLSYNGHLTERVSTYFRDTDGNIYRAKGTFTDSSHYYSEINILGGDAITGDILTRFKAYLNSTYGGGLGTINVMCVGLHNDLMLFTYTCTNNNIVPYGTSRNSNGYYINNMPDNVPIMYYDKSSDSFGYWGYADFSIITDTYSRIYIAAIGDRNGTNSGNVNTGEYEITFAIAGKTSNNEGQVYIVNGVVNDESNYKRFVATTYQKIPIFTASSYSSPRINDALLGLFYQANSATFYAQGPGYWDNSGYNSKLGRDTAHFMLAPVPTDGTVEINTYNQTINFGSPTQRVNDSFRKAAYPLSGIGGADRCIYIYDSNDNCYYKITKFNYDNCPILFDIKLNGGDGIDLNSSDNVTIELTLEANTEINYDAEE